EDVREGMAETGYPPERVHYCVGKVEDTLPERAPERIALLRRDTDWYESTRHELAHLYSRVSPGRVPILDDYSTWQGARKAIAELLARHWALVALLAVGLVLRIVALVAIYPGTFFSDTNDYVDAAATGTVSVIRVSGYALFVAPFYALRSAGALVEVQHLLG